MTSAASPDRNTATRFLGLSLLVWAAFLLVRRGVAESIPGIGPAEMARHDWAMVTANLALAGAMLWMGLKRYGRPRLWNAPGRKSLAMVMGLGVLASCAFTWAEQVMQPMDPTHDVMRVAALALGLSLALSEEIGFRGTIFEGLKEWKGELWAVLGSAFLFTAVHMGERICAASPRTALGGLALSLARLRGVGLTGLILIHFCVEAAWALFLPMPAPLDAPRELIAAGINAVFCLVLWKMKPRSTPLAS